MILHRQWSRLWGTSFPLIRQGLDPCCPNGQLKLMTSACNQLKPLCQVSFLQGTLLPRTHRFFPSGCQNHCQYSLHRPTEGWPTVYPVKFCVAVYWWRWRCCCGRWQKDFRKRLKTLGLLAVQSLPLQLNQLILRYLFIVGVIIIITITVLFVWQSLRYHHVNHHMFIFSVFLYRYIVFICRYFKLSLYY